RNNDIADFQRHRFADDRYERNHIEEHVGGRRVLHNLTGAPGLQTKPSRTRRKIVRRDEGRAERAGRVDSCPAPPRGRVELVVTNGGVVEDRVTGNITQRPFRGDMSAPLADDDGQFSLVIQLLRGAWPNDRRAVTNEGRVESREKRGIFRLFVWAFLGVI